MVTIPRVQKFQQTSGLPSNQRINVQARDQASNIMQQTNTVTGLVEQADQLYYDYENQKIDQLSKEAENEYSQWNNDQLARLKNYEGDPTDIYAEYETQATEKYQEIINKRPDLNDRVKRHLTANLNKTVESQRVQTLKQRGAQQETYANNLYESSIKLKKNTLADNAGFIRLDDPGSYTMFDENISDIRTTIAKRSVEKGLGTIIEGDSKDYDHAYRDPDGNVIKVKLSDMAKIRTSKELSEGIYASLNSMNAAGYNDEAKAAYERYKPYLDAKSRTALNNKFQTSEVKGKAFEEMSKIEGRSDEDQMRYIENVKDGKLKSELLKIKDTNDNRRENIRQRRYKANYNLLANRVVERMNSSNPYFGLADLESDPVYGQVWDKLDAKGKKAIVDAVQVPKQTNVQSEAAIQSLFFGDDPNNDIASISPADFNTYLSGLSSSDRKKYTNMYNRMRTQTGAEERTVMSRASKLLTDQLILDDHIKRDKYGKISGDDELSYINARNKLIDHLSTQGKMSEKELKDFVKDFSAAEVKGKVFSPTPRAVFNSGPRGRVTEQSLAPASKNEVTLTPEQLSNYRREFRLVHRYFPSVNDEKFKNYVTAQQGRR